MGLVVERPKEISQVLSRPVQFSEPVLNEGVSGAFAGRATRVGTFYEPDRHLDLDCDLRFGLSGGAKDT